jgi:hypothetical protein
MVDVLLNTEDVVVLGPPETVDVLVDIGPQGVRGNKIIVGSGEPNTLTTNGVIFGQSLILNDTYINTSPGVNYAYMYQYISAPGGNTWVEILRINPTIYSSIQEVQFNSGAATLSIPVSSIVISSGLTIQSSNFNIHHSIVGPNPISSSFQVAPLSEDGTNLSLVLYAVEYVDGSWEPVSEAKEVHIFISIV